MNIEGVDPQAYAVVERAAAFLDSREDFPKDWRDRIDLDTLDIRDTCLCIVGQGAGNQKDRPAAHDLWCAIDLAWSIALGWGDGQAAFAASRYEAAWKAYIIATRAEGSKDSNHDSQEPDTATSKPCEPRHRIKAQKTTAPTLSVLGGEG